MISRSSHQIIERLLDIFLTQDTAGVFDNIRQVQKKCLFPDPHNSTDLFSTLDQSGVNERVRSHNCFFKFLISKKCTHATLRYR